MVSSKQISLKHWLKFLGLAFLLAVLAGCGGSPGSSVSAEMESDVGWTIGNFAPEYWNSDPRPSAIIGLSARFKDSSITKADIESIEVSNSLSPDFSWNYTGAEISDRFFTSQSTGKKGVGFGRLWSRQLATNGSAIYLGTYTIEVVLKNGKRSSVKLDTPAPGALTAGAFRYVYSPENYLGTPPSDYIALPKRATIGATAINTTDNTLTLNFSVQDDKVYNGWVLFFDAQDKYLGYTQDFVNFETRALYGKLNGGSGLRTDGTMNALTLSLTDIGIPEGGSPITLNAIERFELVLSDGKQYVGTTLTYDTYSLSVGKLN